MLRGFQRREDGQMGLAEAEGKLKIGDRVVRLNGEDVESMAFHVLVSKLGGCTWPLTAQFRRAQHKMAGGHSSKYRGVNWKKSRNKWEANIRYDSRLHYLGCFEDEEEAARAYDRAARTHKGEKAQPNFPTKKEEAAKEAKQTRSTYRGVYWHKSRNKWVARIWCDGKQHHLGRFEEEEAAARAYDRAARAHKGEKAQLNFEGNEEAAKAYDSAARAQHGETAQLNVPAEGESGFRKSSKYRGVSWDKRSSKWHVRLYCDDKQHSLGHFEDEEEAARAYDRAAKVHKGERAQLNFSTKQRNQGKV
jgi:hypothetical protein